MSKVINKYKGQQAAEEAPPQKEAVQVTEAPAPKKEAPPAAPALPQTEKKEAPQISVDIEKLVEKSKESDMSGKNQVDNNSEHNLEDQIEQQAKQIADQQRKQQQLAQSKGKVKISQAALALNNMEMGIESQADSSSDSVMGISMDQLYTNFGDGGDTQANQKAIQNNEAAAITMAKQAATMFVQQHPESQVFEKDGPPKNITQTLSEQKKVEPPTPVVEPHSTDKANVEIESLNGLEYGTGFENGEKSEGSENDQKYVVADDSFSQKKSLAETSSEEDLSVPKWPQYEEPTQQMSKIKEELA